MSSDSLPKWSQIVLAILILLAFTYAIFWQNITKNYDFLLGGDNLAAAPISEMGKSFLKAGGVPNWCPYIFCGMPMVGSLLFANHYYFAFLSPFAQIIALPFLGSKFGWLFFHYLLAGFGVFLLLRTLKVHWTFAVLCGLLFAFNPPMVVYADVGHGSKVMTIAYFPWILYFIIRLFQNPRILWAALLALFYGLQLLALHMQLAYYGAMMMGLYVLYAFIAGGKAALGKNIKATLLLISAGIIAFGLASPLYMQILEYSKYSIRGGGATGGATWDYATAWSFHPLESLTYILPSFYGYGGGTYWGHMPFTDMPVYWGAVALLFAPWALILKRDRLTTFLVILALAAWIVSFGKFFPVLYRPFYEFLPFFNKFRVPSLIQVLVLLSAVLLAGRGMQAILERLKDKTAAVTLAKKFFIVGGIIAGLCFLFLILQGAFRPIFLKWIISARPQMSSQDVSTAFGSLVGDVARLLLFVVLLYGAAYLTLSRKAPSWILVAAALIVVIFELAHFDEKLVHPTPPQYMESYLQADDVVRYLQQQPGPFRIFPLSKTRSQDWYMPHHLESIDGYSAAKIQLYQTARDSLTLTNPHLLQLMNTLYFISDRPISHPDLEEVFTGQKERVYRYKRAFPRAFLINQVVIADSTEDIFNLYRSRDFNFSKTAVLESPLDYPLDPRAGGTVKWTAREPDHLALNVETNGRQLLVLSEVYYPSGWTATVDGKLTPILKTDYLFRGIVIPAGAHRVELTFDPLTARSGNAFRRIAEILILAALLWAGWRSLQKARREEI